ncbi:MAG: flagellar motor protein MotB [Magnetovibrionaceae bacterium]
MAEGYDPNFSDDPSQAVTAGAGGHASDGDGTIALFLALYLVVLAFFILLVTISSLEETRSEAVMDSLTSTFTTILPPATELQDFASRDGDVIAAQEFQQDVTNLFTTTIRVAKVDVIQPGRLMRVSFPTSVLFAENEARLRPGQVGLVDRLVSTLSGRAAGLRHDLEFVVGSRYTTGVNLPVGQTLQMARAGEFARSILARGAPPDSISIGLKPGAEDQITLWFFIRTVEETRERFEEALEQRAEKLRQREAEPAAPQPRLVPQQPSRGGSGTTLTLPLPGVQGQ